MSNPFAVFRKNQKAWMAGLVLLAILAFVIAPAIQTATSAFTGAGSAGREVVVSWTGGKITIGDLQTASARHAALVRFLGALGEEVIEAGGQPQVPNFTYNPQTEQILSVGIQSSSNEADVCRTRILASYAQRIGIEMSDDTADEFIREFCDECVSTQRVEEILAEAAGGRLTWFEVRELLKEELAAIIVGQTATAGLSANSPGKMYRDFEKLNLTAKVEAYPVFVDEYLTQVADSPTEADIKAIYEIGSTRVASSNSAEAGFVRPYQVNVQYIEGSSKAWTERAKADVTESELKEEYERRIELGQLKVPVEEPASPSDDAASDTDPEDGETAEGETAESETTASETAEGEAPAAGEQSDDSAQEASDAGAPDTGDEGPDESDQGALENKQSVKLVSFTQEPEQQEQDDQQAQEETEAGEQEEEKPPTPPAVEAPSSENGVEAEESGELQLSDDSTTGDVAEGEEELATAVPTEPEMRTQTFEEARETILESLASQKGREAQLKAIEELLEEQKKYFGLRRQYQAFIDAELTEDEDGNPRVPPEKPDMKKLAEAAGLIFNETGLIDGTKLAQLPIGQANIINADPQTGIGGSIANLMMNQGIAPSQPLEAQYFDQAALMAGTIPDFVRFLCWKEEEKAPYIPELDEVRDEVTDFWKRQQARGLAFEEAEKLSKEVKLSGEDPWAGALSETQKALIIESDPFTWMNRFNDFAMISTVSKLDSVGGEFMQQVFNGQAGQTVVAANGPKTVYYVTRIVEFSPDAETLRGRFNADPLKSGPINIANQETNRLVVDWYENLERELGVQWQMNVGQNN